MDDFAYPLDFDAFTEWLNMEHSAIYPSSEVYLDLLHDGVIDEDTCRALVSKDFIHHVGVVMATLAVRSGRTEFVAAVAAIILGKAEPHELWMGLSDEHERDGYALRPLVWEGPGEYQHISYMDGRDGLVRVPDGALSLQYSVKVALRKQGASHGG